MYDEFRAIYRVLHDALRQGPCRPAPPLPVAHYAFLQGVVLALNFRSVVDTCFDGGFRAAAIALAFNRLQRTNEKCRYLVFGGDRELSSYAFSFLKRRYPDLTRHVVVVLRDATAGLPTLGSNSADLGIMLDSDRYPVPKAEFEHMARVVRPGGMIAWWPGRSDTSPGQNGPADLPEWGHHAVTIGRTFDAAFLLSENPKQQ
jgi:SAM-dependent methyltransferase